MVGRTRVLAVREHLQTISGRKDHATGQTVVNQINLGWFVHLEFENTGPIAVGLGPDKPNLEVGQRLEFILKAIG